jgi:hypothetical protein
MPKSISEHKAMHGKKDKNTRGSQERANNNAWINVCHLA